MSNGRFWITYVILVLCQMVVCNFFNFSPFVFLSLLPVMVLCIPVKVNLPWTMVIAFVTGIAVDYTADGLLGLNALALVPVAFARNAILVITLGKNNYGEPETPDFGDKGFGKVAVAVLLSTGLFCLLYTVFDGAGARPVGFLAIRYLLSTAISFLGGLLVIRALGPERKKI
ncbi:MAG: hypothetical protein LUD72_12035 [Bacteroidales bacterium]|nr:hypothetical protein [Bacteroidales bacterium]